MALVMTKLLKVSRMWHYPFLEPCGHFSPFPRHLCGRIVLVARFLPEFCPQILEHEEYAHEVQNADGPLLSRLFTWRKVPF